MRRARADAGYTLLELVVVMAILGILAAIAIPLVSAQRKREVDAQMKSDLRAVASRMELYFSDTNSYPGSITMSGRTATLTGEYVVKLAQGESVSVTTPARPGSINTFCLIATRTAGSAQGTQNGWVWINDKGGLQGAGVTACS